MLSTNQFLISGGYLVAQNQQYIGIMQNDGRFCVYRGNSIAKPGPIVSCMPAAPQPFAVYNLWMRDDGNLCISYGRVPALAAPAAAAGQPQPAPTTCMPGTPRPRGDYFAAMMNNGALELFAGRAGNPKPNVAYWTMKSLPPLPAPSKMVALTLGPLPPVPPKPPQPPAPGHPAPKPAPPATLTAYAMDASGKPDPRFPPISCGQQCSGMFPEGARIAIMSSLPLARWTGACAAGNKAAANQASTRCELTMGANPMNVGGVLH